MSIIKAGCQIAKNANNATGIRRGFIETLNTLPPEDKGKALAALAEARRSIAGLPFFAAQMVAGIVNAESMIPKGMRSILLTREDAESIESDEAG